MAVKDLQNKLDALTANNKSNWEEKAIHLIENDDWLKHSRKIAIKINRHLKDNGMQKQELATLLEVSPQQVSKIVKGRENLTLQTISKIEKALGISLFGLDSNKEKQNKVSLKIENTYATPIHGDESYEKKSAKVVKMNFSNNQTLLEYSFKMEGIQFNLKKINTEQFAIIEDAYNSQIKDISLETHVTFGIASKSASVISAIKFQFKQNEKSFLIVEGSCEFGVEKNKWNEFQKEGKIILQKEFLIDLVTITVGTIRGILHSKTTNTKFNEFILPTIDITKLVTEDMEFDE